MFVIVPERTVLPTCTRQSHRTTNLTESNPKAVHIILHIQMSCFADMNVYTISYVRICYIFKTLGARMLKYFVLQI